MRNRRQFIGSLPVLAAGCASANRMQVRDGAILDTHVHFYDPKRPQGVPWPPKDDSFLYRTVLPEELKAMAKPLGVAGAIVVEASSWVEDNDWILEMARTEPFIKGLVGHLKPGRKGFADDLGRLRANPLFRGIRVGLWDIPLQPENSDFIRDLKELDRAGLCLDVLGGPEQTERIARIASALPHLRIVIDHCAGVRINGGAPDTAWTRDMQNISKHPNVFMKVSALAEGTGREHAAPSDTQFYKPVLDTLWNIFGEDRVLFGSNWPVSARFADYPTVLKIVREYVSARSAIAAEKYFRRNAERIYLQT